MLVENDSSKWSLASVREGEEGGNPSGDGSPALSYHEKED